MSNKLLETLGAAALGALSPVLESIVETKVGDLLDKFHDSDPSGYEATVKGLSIGLTQLERVTDATTTKIDDAVVGAMEKAVQASAFKHGVELPK